MLNKVVDISLQAEIKKILDIGFAEDIGDGDVTGNAVIPKDANGRFVFVAREQMVLCGAGIIKLAFNIGGGEVAVKLLAKDGEFLKSGAIIARIEGNVREILARERVMLNLMQHLSDIATETAKYVAVIKGTKAKILDTRKTLPGLRALEKYAVKCGGGVNHRMGLFDMVMIKDNHIRAAGGITAAVKKARGTGLKIEVECDTLEQAHEALAAGADIIMADNMSLPGLREVVAAVKGKVPVEASGNVNLETVRAIAETGVDFISTSKITMAARPIDIGLDEVD